MGAVRLAGCVLFCVVVCFCVFGCFCPTWLAMASMCQCILAHCAKAAGYLNIIGSIAGLFPAPVEWPLKAKFMLKAWYGIPKFP